MIFSKKRITHPITQVTFLETDRKRFVAAAEETLAGIYEGNFARILSYESTFRVW